jgi:hypothetical protein
VAVLAHIFVLYLHLLKTLWPVDEHFNDIVCPQVMRVLETDSGLFGQDVLESWVYMGKNKPVDVQS